MPPEYLTKDTFEAWAAGFDLRLKDIAAVRDKVDAHGIEIGVLKDRSNRSERRTGVISSLVSAAVAGAVLAFRAIFFGSHA